LFEAIGDVEAEIKSKIFISLRKRYSTPIQVLSINIPYVIVRVHFGSFFIDIVMPMGASAAIARGVLIVKKLIKCSPSIIVSNLFLYIQHLVWYFKK